MEHIHLHVHSDYSVLDGYARIEEIVARARVIGHKAIALTDHGTLGGIIHFYEEADANGIKPILGCEFYYVPYDDFVRERSYYHLTVLAENEEGYRNLLRLSYLSYAKGFYYKPRINKRLLFEHNRGLIVTTGCVQGHIPQLILRGQHEEAEKAFLEMLEVFKDRFYVELYDHGLKIEKTVSDHLLELSSKYDVKVIATNDAHYAYREHYEAHDVFLGIQTGTDVEDVRRLRLVDESGEVIPEFYIKSTEEMLLRPLFQEHPEALTNTMEVAERCNVSIPFSKKLAVPVVTPVDNFYDYVLRQLRARLSEIDGNVIERLKYEVTVIERMGFVDYFLLVKDIVDLARLNDIMVGPARGSAGGSLVAYALGITDINPLKYDLYFERFLNPERVSPPDIDIDFEDSKRYLLLQIIKERYGANKVAHITTYVRLGVRVAIRDVARFYRINQKEIDDFVKKSIPQKPNITFDDVENPERNSGYKFYITNYQKYKDVLETSKHFYGRIRHSGIHASGIIIGNEELYDKIPVQYSAKEDVNLTQIEYEYCEKLGFVKVDILGLTTLTLIRRILEILHCYNVEVDFRSLSLDDDNVYCLFRYGYTTGIFQFESEQMKRFLVKLQPNCFSDIVALNALYRPGPMNEIDRYIARKHGKEEISYPDNRLEPVLKETYGIIVYQEQIMRIAQIIANYSLAEADILRRAIGKKIKEIIDNNRTQFVERAVANGVDEQTAAYIFDLIERFAEYGFNKSHAVGYATLAYWTAYLKTYYPHIFFSVLIDLYAKDSDREYIRTIYQEAEKLGIRIYSPKDKARTTAINRNEIVLGLCTIRDVSEKTAEDVATLCGKTSLGQLKQKLNKKTLEALLNSGALDSITSKRTLSEYQNQLTLFENETKTSEMDVRTDKTEIENEITYIGAVLSEKYRIKYVSRVKHILCDKSLYDNGYLYRTIEVPVIYVICKILGHKKIKHKNTVYYQVEAYDNYGTFTFNSSEKHVCKLVSGNIVVLELRRNERISSWYLHNVITVNELLKKESIIARLYVPAGFINQDNLEKWRYAILPEDEDNNKNSMTHVFHIYGNSLIEDDSVLMIPEVILDVDKVVLLDDVKLIILDTRI